MWLQNSIRQTRLALAALLFLIIAAGGCGYQFSGGLPSALGDTEKTLKVKSIDQPTTYPWMTYVVRNALRDEVNARNLARWADSGSADNEIVIKVHSYTMRAQVRDKDDKTLIFSGSMTISATVYDGTGNNIVWRSSNISYSDIYVAPEEKAAAEELSRELMRRLCQEMRMKF